MAGPIDIHEKSVSEILNTLHTKSTNGQSYYWYNDSKVYMTETDDVFVILKEEGLKYLDSNVQVFNIGKDEYSSGQTNILVSDAEDEPPFYYGMRINASIVSDFGENVIYSAPYYLLPTGKEVGLSELFLVKLKAAADYVILEQFANLHKVNIVKNMSRPLWYKLSCSINSTDNALRMANLAHESGLFASAEAIFINNITLDTDLYNDPEYDYQWNISPNESYSINLGNVHSITSGEKDVMVAIIDTGFQLDHPDISMTSGWDATHRSTCARLYEYDNPKYTFHGTGTAGIIGAKANNNLGIVGIAPGVTMFPISVHFDPSAYRNITDALVDAIDFSIARGADVISNSWSSPVHSEYITEAIQDAIDNGRNGKGSVVVFSSGNDSSIVSMYPHADIPDIISVGNTDDIGCRRASSNYGPDLDIVAPGTTIRTLRPESMYYNATGTSFSCPHVSAVAALMLSVNPGLSQSEVSDILAITANKIDTYDFVSNTSKPNGLWNNEVGYGLLNCYDAVSLAYYYNESNYLNLIEFDYSDSQVEIDLKVEDNIAIIWDWEAKDISFINATATEPKDTTISHNYGATGSRRIIIAETVEPGETVPTSSTALTRFDLTTGSGASNIEILPVNSVLEYVRIIGGSSIVSQTIIIEDLPALKDLYLVRMPGVHVVVGNCPSLQNFGSSKYIWGAPTPSVIVPLVPGPGIGDILDPNVVGGGSTTPVWPDVPEPYLSFSALRITDCNALKYVSLENVDIKQFDFSDFPSLQYLYVSSHNDRIVGGTSSLLTINSSGEFLVNTIATLPARGALFKGKILVRGVNLSNTEYVEAAVAAKYQNQITTFAEENNWNVVWDSGVTSTW